ncbi:MAG: glycine oxidase ThiO [Candidatus Dormibacteria bacterium]
MPAKGGSMGASSGATDEGTFDVAIIGGGVIGGAIAWRCAQAGLSTALIDPSPGSGASGVAAGMLGPVSEASFGEGRLLALSLQSWRLFPALVEELEAFTGESTGHHRCGTLMVARDQDDARELARGLRFRLSLGLRAERLSSRQCRELEPALAPTVRGGILVEDDHQVDPRRLVAALLHACGRLGVRTLTARGELLLSGDSVHGVRCDDGSRVAARSVVLAAGCWSGTVAGVPAVARPPVRPVKGQILRLATGAAPLAARVVRGLDVYIVSRPDGEVVVGSTEEERGFDTTVTAGAVHRLLHDATELVPDVGELELVEAAAGLRPGSPDNAPLIGSTAVPGLLVATGHHRNGVLLAPITAEAVVGALRGLPLPEVVRPFSPLRFGASPEAAA